VNEYEYCENEMHEEGNQKRGVAQVVIVNDEDQHCLYCYLVFVKGMDAAEASEIVEA
jgi:hypothetical protein